MLSREDFLDAPPTPDDATTPPPAVAADPPRRPLHGGWILMVAAGLLAAVANYALLTADQVTVPVAVVVADAPVGTPLPQLQLDMAAVPLADPAAHLLVDQAALRQLQDRVTAVDLPAGALLRTSDLRVAVGAGEGAMSVPVETARAVGGMLRVGDRVDVIAGASRAIVVARDLPVVAVAGDDGGGLGVATTAHVTVAVDEDDALAVAQALREGPVDLVRRAGGGSG